MVDQSGAPVTSQASSPDTQLKHFAGVDLADIDELVMTTDDEHPSLHAECVAVDNIMSSEHYNSSILRNMEGTAPGDDSSTNDIIRADVDQFARLLHRSPVKMSLHAFEILALKGSIAHPVRKRHHAWDYICLSLGGSKESDHQASPCLAAF